MTRGLGAVVLGALLWPSPVAGQAWVPPARAGSVSVFVQQIKNTGHLLDDGTLLPDGKSVNVGVGMEVEYGITDRLSMTAGLPHISSKYIGPGETPFQFLPVDACRCYHNDWQDISIAGRYNVVNLARRTMVTPSVTFVVPSHTYAYRGEAVAGRGLREWQFAVDAGHRLDVISRRLAVDGRYAYAIVQRVLDIPNNRSNASAGVRWAFSRRVSARGMLSWQRTHGGLRMPQDVAPYPERIPEHDRLLQDNYLHIGASVGFSISPSLDVFASATRYISGTNSHAGHVFTVGFSVPFEFHAKAPGGSSGSR